MTAATGMGDAQIALADRMRSCCKDAPMRDANGCDTLDSWVMRWQEELRALAASPAPVVGNELYNLVAQAIRSTGIVTNTDKWEVAESVITALSCRYGWKDEDRG